MIVKFSLLHPDAAIPHYAKPGDNGMDLTAVKTFFQNGYYVYELGIAVEVPEGYVGLIFPRSSISNTDLSLSNAVAVIDSSFTGPVSLRFKTAKCDAKNIYKVGDRVGQLVIVPAPHITPLVVPHAELRASERGNGSFGHTGS